MSEVCTITITTTDHYDRDFGFDMEDCVKNAWVRMVPWFTNRHGIRQGSMSLNDGAVQIEWRYEYPQEEEGA